MSSIRLVIDRLILRGFEPGTQKALVEGLQSELSQILSSQATRADWARSRRTPVLKLGRMPLEAGPSGGRTFGKKMARSIGGKLKP